MGVDKRHRQTILSFVKLGNILRSDLLIRNQLCSTQRLAVRVERLGNALNKIIHNEVGLHLKLLVEVLTLHVIQQDHATIIVHGCNDMDILQDVV